MRKLEHCRLDGSHVGTDGSCRLPWTHVTTHRICTYRAVTTPKPNLRCRRISYCFSSYLRLNVLLRAFSLYLNLPFCSVPQRAPMQLSLLIFSSIMVHMMVKASFIGNSTDYRVQAVQIVVR